MTSVTESAACNLCEYRYLLYCETASPLHVGSGQPGATTDAELRRNSRGELVVPGTSIAGTVRRTIERLANVDIKGSDGCQLYQPMLSDEAKQTPCQCCVCEFMGNVRPVALPDHSRLKPATESKVHFHDALLGEKTKTRVVDSVAIDRKRRAASDARKFDYAQVLPGTPVAIEVHAENLTKQQQKWLGAALRMLASGEVRIGGRTNRGHGLNKVTDTQKSECKILSRDLGQIDDLLAAVTHANDDEASWSKNVFASSLDEFPGSELTLPNRLSVSFGLQSCENSTLLIADPVAAARTGFDHAMRRFPANQAAAQNGTSPPDQQGPIDLPASSFVGALRSGAERIVRTITQGKTASEQSAFHCDLLSSHCTKSDPNELSKLCLICQLFGNPDFASRLSATIDTVASGHDVPFDHVAIDRFTGGATDQKKFDALAVRHAQFDIRLTLDPIDDPETARWMIGLLTLTLRDLHDGRIWLGYGSSRGHGLMQFDPDNLPAWKLPEPWPDITSNLQDCVNALWNKLEVEMPAAEKKA